MRALAALVLLTLAGCGGGPPSSVVPADATIYVSTSAAEAERLTAAISRDLDFERDVRPWLGERAAYFTWGSVDEYGLVLAAEDEDAAEEFGERVALVGPLRASAVIDGHLVLASSRELLRAANAAAGGQSLADSARLDVAGEDEENAPDVLLATDDAETFASGIDAFGVDAGPALDRIADGPLTARSWGDLVEVDGVPPSAAPPSLESLSGGVRIAIATGDASAGDAFAPAREALEAAGRWPDDLDLAPFLRHAGAGTMAVQGERARIGAEIQAEAADEAALRREVAALARRLPRKRYIVDHHPVEGGVRLLASPRNARRPHFLVVATERLTIATGEAIGGAAEDLGDTERYRAAERALGGPPTMLLDTLAVRDDGRGTLRISRAGG